MQSRGSRRRGAARAARRSAPGLRSALCPRRSRIALRLRRELGCTRRCGAGAVLGRQSAVRLGGSTELPACSCVCLWVRKAPCKCVGEMCGLCPPRSPRLWHTAADTGVRSWHRKSWNCGGVPVEVAHDNCVTAFQDRKVIAKSSFL